MNTHISHFLCTLVSDLFSWTQMQIFTSAKKLAWFLHVLLFLLLSINVVTRDQSCESIVGKQQSGINHFQDDRHV